MGALEEAIALLARAPAKNRAAIEKAVLEGTKHMRWVPNPGPQTQAYLSKADVLLYGGEPGGGKSDLLLGMAFNCHGRSLLMRRRYTDLGFLTERAIQVNGTRDGYSGAPPPKLRIKDRAIDFGAAANIGDEQHWMGNPHDLLGLDEACQFAKVQVDLLMGWVRSGQEGQRKRVIFATNPPLSAEGLWVNQMFAPWLDDRYPNPAKPGELRWVVRDDQDQDKWVDGPEPVSVGGKMVKPLSRTYIPASVQDNPYYAKTDYQAQLDAMPEIYKSVLLGHFKTTLRDQERQVIPTDWIRAAQARWTNKPPDHIPQCTIAADLSGGGNDPLILARRHDGWYAPLIEVKGKEIPMDSIGSYTAGLIIMHRRDQSTVVLDMGGGYGGSTQEHLKSNNVDVFGYRGAEASPRRSKDGKLHFTNTRSAAYWLFREALDPGQPGGSPIALPDDPVLVADLTAPTFEVTPNGIKITPKEKLAEQTGRSTDRGDAVIMAWWGGPKEATAALDWAERKMRRTIGPAVVLGRSGQIAQRRAGVRR